MRRTPARPVRAAVSLVIATLILWTFAPAASADDGLEVTTPYPAVAVAPGTNVSFDLKVSSTRAANVALELSGVPQAWSASLLGGGFVVDGVAVTPGTDGEVRLDVDVPADEPAGTTTLRLTARGGGAQDVLPIAIRVNAEAAGDITLTTSTPTLTGASDATFTFDLQYQNDTAQDLTVSVAASGPPEWDVKATLTGEEQAASTVVEAGATQNITVTANAPEDIAAGPYPIKVEARAGDRTATADLGIEVTGSYSMTLSTPNDLLSASGSAGAPTTQAFEITNTGTGPLTEVVAHRDPADAVDGHHGARSRADHPARRDGHDHRDHHAIGRGGRGRLRGHVQRQGGRVRRRGTAQVRFTVETSPLWALVGLALIVLILAGLFYVFRTYGRR